MILQLPVSFFVLSLLGGGVNGELSPQKQAFKCTQVGYILCIFYSLSLSADPFRREPEVLQLRNLLLPRQQVLLLLVVLLQDAVQDVLVLHILGVAPGDEVLGLGQQTRARVRPLLLLPLLWSPPRRPPRTLQQTLMGLGGNYRGQ